MVSLRSIRQLSCRADFPGFDAWARLPCGEKGRIRVMLNGKVARYAVACDLDAQTVTRLVRRPDDGGFELDFTRWGTPLRLETVRGVVELVEVGVVPDVSRGTIVHEAVASLGRYRS